MNEDAALLENASAAEDEFPPSAELDAANLMIDIGSHRVSLLTLLKTRLLVQGSSGAGKSWLLRRIAEQTADVVQQIIIDPDGEFHTLRDRFPYLYCACDADIKPRVSTARHLAHELRRTRASIIIDLYDLDPDDRAEFMGEFGKGLLSAPRHHWKPALVLIDEIHLFAPQVSRPLSFKAVEGIACRGRKRGLGLVAGTQRLSKLHKDVAAELLNKAVGRTGLDTDIARAADELGWTKREARKRLAPLEPGQFYAHGPAIATTVERLQVGDVQTAHGTNAFKAFTPPVRDLAAIEASLKEVEAEADALLRAAAPEDLEEEPAAESGDRAAPAPARRRRRKPRVEVSAKVRAKATRHILSAADTGRAIRAAAIEHNVTPQTVRNWLAATPQPRRRAAKARTPLRRSTSKRR